VVQHTGEMPGQPLIVDAYPAGSSEARLYEDDGESRDYLNGAWLTRRFAQRRSGGLTTIEVSAAEGGWRPAERELRFRILTEAAPRVVRLGTETLAALAADQLPASGSGWARSADGFVVVKLRDRFDGFRLSLEP
jgi:hypothetical protein